MEAIKEHGRGEVERRADQPGQRPGRRAGRALGRARGRGRAVHADVRLAREPASRLRPRPGAPRGRQRAADRDSCGGAPGDLRSHPSERGRRPWRRGGRRLVRHARQRQHLEQPDRGLWQRGAAGASAPVEFQCDHARLARDVRHTAGCRARHPRYRHEERAGRHPRQPGVREEVPERRQPARPHRDDRRGRSRPAAAAGDRRRRRRCGVSRVARADPGDDVRPAGAVRRQPSTAPPRR